MDLKDERIRVNPTIYNRQRPNCHQYPFVHRNIKSIHTAVREMDQNRTQIKCKPHEVSFREISHTNYQDHTRKKTSKNFKKQN